MLFACPVCVRESEREALFTLQVLMLNSDVLPISDFFGCPFTRSFNYDPYPIHVLNTDPTVMHESYKVTHQMFFPICSPSVHLKQNRLCLREY